MNCDGRFLPEWLRRFPAAQSTVVDVSLRMLEIARKKTGSRRVEFVHADVLDWQVPAVVTS